MYQSEEGRVEQVISCPSKCTTLTPKQILEIAKKKMLSAYGILQTHPGIMCSHLKAINEI